MRVCVCVCVYILMEKRLETSTTYRGIIERIEGE